MGIERPGGPYAAEMTDGGAWPGTDENDYFRYAEELGRQSKQLTEALEDCQGRQALLFNGPHVWVGDAASAAAAEIGRYTEAMQTHQRQFAAAIRRAVGTGEVLIWAKTQITTNVESAQAEIATYASNPLFTAAQKAYFIGSAVKAAHAENLAVIEAGVAKLGASPTAIPNVRLVSNGHRVPLAPSKPAGDTTPDIPAAGTDPAAVTNWWNSLTPEQQQKLISAHPPELGDLHGIPTEVRSQINTAVMNDDISRVENATEAISPTDMTRYSNALQTREGLVANATNPDGSRNPVFLQTYDPGAFDGRGRAVIAIGNPDTADNTTVLVPGTGSSVRDGYLTHDDGRNLYNETRRADPSKTNSVLVWMGYHAPDSPTDPQIGQPTLARQGGGLLAGDVNALEATHQGAASHVTVIGHSYGSTTVADAAAGSGMHANDVVLVGCPGTDLAHSAADFHLAEDGHLYVGATSSDPITHLGGDVPQAHVPGTGVTVGLGNDPALEGYGSTRFKAETPGLTSPLADHSSYFKRDSESLFSIADITSGHGDALARDHMTAEHRGTYWMPDDFDPEAFRPGTGGHYH